MPRATSPVRPALLLGLLACAAPATAAVASDDDTAVPAAFAQAGARFEPAREAHLVVVDTALGRLSYYQRGRLVDRLDIALGQAVGPKRRRGDLRTPHGVYFVVDKYQGEFSGDYAAYYGGHWIKLNYPGPLDAARGEAAGLIDAPTRATIERAWRARRATPQRTALGGGIGFHGWIEEWDGAISRQLSWGCVVLHLRDIAAFYARVPLGAMVILR